MIGRRVKSSVPHDHVLGKLMTLLPARQIMRVPSNLFRKIHRLFNGHRLLLIHIEFSLSAFHSFRLIHILGIVIEDPLF